MRAERARAFLTTATFTLLRAKSVRILFVADASMPRISTTTAPSTPSKRLRYSLTIICLTGFDM